jgi:hypothetical protein
LWCDAAIATALYIVRVRRSGSREHKVAKKFLHFVDVERLVQAAMMCDGGDESLQLLRMCDDPDLDMATAPDEIAAYTSRVDFLFLQGGCLNTEGYTRRVIDNLQSHVVTFQVDGIWKSIGGPEGVQADVVQRCLARMGCWVRVAKSVLSAEFPAFELLQSFSIFTAAAKVSTGMCPTAFIEENLRHFQRLAHTFSVDANEFATQFVDHVFIAKQIMQSSPGVSLREAWKEAILRTQKANPATRANHPVNALRPVVVRYLVYVASTTAIEHGFAKRLRTLSPQQNSCSEDMEVDLIKVILDSELAKDPSTITLAQQIWSNNFGKPRVMTDKIRLSKGVPHHKRTVKPSEASFQRKRRIDVRLAVRRGGQPGVVQVDEQSAWCESHQHEIDFQEKKLKKRMIEAYHDGLLLEDEVDDRLRRDAAGAMANDKKLAHDRHVADRRHERRQATPLPAEWFAGKSVFVESGGDDDIMRKEIHDLGMTLVPERSHADVMLVADPAVMSKRSLWAAVLKGMHVSTLTGLRGRGAAVKYEPALTSKRHVWFSPAFRAKHPTVVQMLGVFLQGVGDIKIKWRVREYADAADFAGHIRDQHLIGLVLQSEKQEPPDPLGESDPLCIKVRCPPASKCIVVLMVFSRTSLRPRGRRCSLSLSLSTGSGRQVRSTAWWACACNEDPAAGRQGPL